MKKVMDIHVRNEDRFLAHMLAARVGLQSVWVPPDEDDQPGAGRRAARANRIRKLRYFNLGRNVFGLLEIKPETSAPGFRAQMYTTYQSAHQSAISKAVDAAEQFGDHSSDPPGAFDSARLLVHEALACLNSEDSDIVPNAMAHARKATVLDAQYARAWHCMGQCYQRASNEFESINSYMMAIKADAAIFRSWMNLGRRFDRIDEDDRSLYAYRIASELEPQFEGGHELKKQMIRSERLTVSPSPEAVYLSQSRMEELEVLEALHIDTDTRRWPTPIKNGMDQMRKAQWEKSLQSFSANTIAGPAFPVAQVRKAQMLIMLGARETAIQCCDQILSRDSENIMAMTTRATALFHLGRDTEALNAFRAAARVAPDSPLVMYQKAMAEDALGKVGQAVHSYARLICDCPSLAVTAQQYALKRLREQAFFGEPALSRDARSLWRDLARVTGIRLPSPLKASVRPKLFKSPWEFIKEAKTRMIRERRRWVLSTALSHSFGDSPPDDVILKPGLDFMRNSEWQRAASIFETQLDKDPRNTDIRRLAALSLLQLENRTANQKGMVYCNKILRRHPANTDAMLAKAELMFQRARLGRPLPRTRETLHNEAMELLNCAARIDARHPGVLFSKALAEDALGRQDLAAATFRQFVVVAAEDLESQLEYARTRLHHLQYLTFRKPA